MSKQIRISIIIPAYNEERYLGRCLTAIAAQTVQPYEVIVVDNASTDKTSEVAKSFNFVQLVKQPKVGRVYAREAGFAAARGTVLARLDADSIVPPKWTAEITKYFSKPGAMQTAWTGAGLFYNIRMPKMVSWYYNLLVFRFNAVISGHPTLWGSNMALPKQLWEQVRSEICLRNDIHEDLDLAMHLHKHKVPVHYDPGVKVQAQMRRVRSNRHDLWNYLEMWPQTLRIHNRKTWPLCWLVGSGMLFVLTPLLNVFEAVARVAGKKPLRD